MDIMMNERIRKLMENASSGACYDIDENTLVGLEIDIFADLIISECIESGNNLINHYINNHSEQEQAPLLAAIADYSNEIKKHFGVE
jgi:hypothetical protein